MRRASRCVRGHPNAPGAARVSASSQHPLARTQSENHHSTNTGIRRKALSGSRVVLLAVENTPSLPRCPQLQRFSALRAGPIHSPAAGRRMTSALRSLSLSLSLTMKNGRGARADNVTSQSGVFLLLSCC